MDAILELTLYFIIIKELNKLGIINFRHMTKDKVVKFASMLPYMDPEVAKKALDQFPAFKDLAGQLVTKYKIVVDKVLTENTESQNAFYQTCNAIFDSLKLELQKGNLSEDERTHIEDKMLEAAAMIGAKDSENKRFLLKVIAVIGFAATGILGTAAEILGSNSRMTGMGDSDIIET